MPSIAAVYNRDVYVIEGGWDANPVEGPAGGCIHYVEGQNITYNPTRQEVVGEVTYDVFSGTGWNIACTQNGELAALSLYGTSYELVDGMEIVFDISEYRNLLSCCLSELNSIGWLQTWGVKA